MKHFPQHVTHSGIDVDISHNEIEDLIGIPTDLMLLNKVEYGNLDREILDKYWDVQLDANTIEINDLIKKLTLSRNTNKNNTVSANSELGKMIQGHTRSKKIGLWDFQKQKK